MTSCCGVLFSLHCLHESIHMCFEISEPPFLRLHRMHEMCCEKTAEWIEVLFRPSEHCIR